MRRAVVAICLLLAGCSGTGLAAPAQTSIPAPTFTQQPTLVSTPAEVPVALVLPTATPKPPSCAEVSGEYIAKTIELKREWSDAVKLAEHAPRIQLGDRIDKLQTLRRRAEDLPAPGCAVESKLVLVSGMRSTIGALMDFMSQNTGASASSVLLPGTSVDIEASEHAMSALAEMPHSCLPLSSEDVKQLFPQYEWKEKTLPEGETAIEASIPPVTVQVLHENGIVYTIHVSAVMLDDKEYPAAWKIIAPIASALLPNWENRDTWLAEFGAAELGDTGNSKIEHIDVTTVEASHIRLPDSGMELASVVIYVPQRQ